MIDLEKEREVSEETMALVEAVLERLEFHAFEEVLIWSEENASKALRRCLKNTLNDFKSGKLILTSSYPKLKHYSVDSVVNGLQTALTQAQEHQDNLNEQIDALKTQLAKVESGKYVIVPKSPTLKMLKVADKHVMDCNATPESAYKAMIEAAQEKNND